MRCSGSKGMVGAWVWGGFWGALGLDPLEKGLNEGFCDFGFFALPMVGAVVRCGGEGLRQKEGGGGSAR